MYKRQTYYNVNGHQPESVDWFNVLFAQTIAQLRSDAQQDNAILTSLSTVLNSAKRPEFLDEIKVTEINLGEEFPIFSNCRVIPVEDPKDGSAGGRLQARMDVDLSDAITLGIETKLVLNYPRPLVAVMPVALAVSVIRFSGTLSISFIPSPTPPAYPDTTSPKTARRGQGQDAPSDDQAPVDPTPPTTLTFSFLPDYRLELSTHSLLGSRSRLQDVPKIAQLVEARLHDWFDERCVEPWFQQIVLPSLWPRKKNTRGGDAEAEPVATGQEAGDANGNAIGHGSAKGRTAEYDAEEQEQEIRSIPGSFDSVQEESDILSRAPSHEPRARLPTARPVTARTASVSGGRSAPAQSRQQQQPQAATQASQLRHRYNNTYEGEVNSSPPRPQHDEAQHDHAPSDFVSGRDLEQRLLQQRQRQKAGGGGGRGNGGLRPSGVRPSMA